MINGEKVIKQLDDLKAHCDSMNDGSEDHEEWGKDVQALNIAIEAVKKQMPSNVAETKEHPFGECPRCGEDFNSELQLEYEIQYCPFCGQHLDWSEPEVN